MKNFLRDYIDRQMDRTEAVVKSATFVTPHFEPEKGQRGAVGRQESDAHAASATKQRSTG